MDQKTAKLIMLNRTIIHLQHQLEVINKAVNAIVSDLNNIEYVSNKLLNDVDDEIDENGAEPRLHKPLNAVFEINEGDQVIEPQVFAMTAEYTEN